MHLADLGVKGHEQGVVGNSPGVLCRVILVDSVPRLAKLEESGPVRVRIYERIRNVQKPEVINEETVKKDEVIFL